MVIVKILGGLGNQMFQYAYAKSLEQNGYSVKIDISGFKDYVSHKYGLDKYNIDLQISEKHENDTFYKNTLFCKILRKIGVDFSSSIKEKDLRFDNKLLNIKDNSYIEGYFQSEKYFKNIKEIILDQFIINQQISIYTKEIEKQIRNSKNSCSIHVRRGDFINNTNITIHGMCDIEYYKRAMKFLEQKERDINYFIFSCDIDWVKDNLIVKNAIYIETKEKRLPHEDIYLMSLCKNNIIANSTFSWWGAWLNQNQNKIVIAPKIWFADKKLQEQSKDIVCQEWIKI